jgi:hypothetical protein
MAPLTPYPLHLISFPDLMRPQLLEWYSQVHTTRGMPWRKPFDSSLDADARAQRAYEVGDQINVRLQFGLHITFRRRYGFQRSCSSRPKSLLSFPITTGGWRGEHACGRRFDISVKKALQFPDSQGLGT